MNKLRAWWSHRQGLNSSNSTPALAGLDAAAVLARTGWARSVGGSAPYLGLFARAGIGRAEVDAALARLEIHELPSARGCTYVLPAQDFAEGLALAAGSANTDMTVATKHLGVTLDEIDRLCERVLAVTGDEPLDPTAIKDAVGAAVSSLGPEGKRRGQSSTLPLALGVLQERGSIRRVPVNGRLDQQRYGYVRWDPSPLAGVERDLECTMVGLARRYLEWAAPASPAHFRWFSGFSAAAANKAIEELDLTERDGLLLPAELADEFDAFTVPEAPSYTLVASIDGIHLLRRDLGLLLEPADAARPIVAGQADPPHHVILDRGRIVGLWDFDPEVGAIVSHTFIPHDAELDAAIERTEVFVRDQLGDARSFSLDSPKSRAGRLAALRTAR